MKFHTGAHSCGIIGREVQEASKGKFKMARYVVFKGILGI